MGKNSGTGYVNLKDGLVAYESCYAVLTDACRYCDWGHASTKLRSADDIPMNHSQPVFTEGQSRPSDGARVLLCM